MSTYHNLRKLKVVLEYLSSTVNMEVEPYRQMNYIKARAMKIFFPMNYEIKLLYGNRDVTPFDNISIGEFFKNKNIITLKIVPNFDQPVTQQHKNELTPEIGKYSDSKLNKSILICHCGNNEFFSYYCRTCQQFLCKICRINYEHKNHIVIHIELDNLEESVKLYAITLQSEISFNMKSSANYVNKFLKKNFIDISSRQEIISRKLIHVENKYKELFQLLKEDDKGDEDNRINNVISDYNSNSQETHMEIENILEEIYLNCTKRKKRLTFSQCKNYFDRISSKEKGLENDSLEVARVKLNYEVHHIMDKMYDKIEKAIDDVLNSENILGLDRDNFHLLQQLQAKKDANMLKQEHTRISEPKSNRKQSHSPTPNMRVSIIKETTEHEKEAPDSPYSNRLRKLHIPMKGIIATNNPTFSNRIAIEAIDKNEKSEDHVDERSDDHVAVEENVDNIRKLHKNFDENNLFNERERSGQQSNPEDQIKEIQLLKEDTDMENIRWDDEEKEKEKDTLKNHPNPNTVDTLQKRGNILHTENANLEIQNNFDDIEEIEIDAL